MAKPVGFDQKLKLTQLDITASELRYTDKKDMYAKLDEYLKDEIKGDKSRKNAITMLMKIWCLVDVDHKELQNEALKLFPQMSAQEKLVLHWGMVLLAYPFFKDVADEMGNLLKLQNEVPSQQIGRKVKLLYGDRRRVEVALSAVMGSMKAWGVLTSGKNNVYTLKERITISNPILKNWILEVLLRVSEYKVIPVDMVASQTIFFPFDYKISIGEIDSNRIKIDRQGLDTYMLSL